jgi:hypothetical protein
VGGFFCDLVQYLRLRGYAGPIFREALLHATGEIVRREGLSFADFEVRASEDLQGLQSA